MSLSTAEFLRGLPPRGLNTLLPKDIDPVTERLSRKQRLRLATLFIAASADKRLTPVETMGVMYFTQIVKTADDIIDRNPRDFNDPEELRECLLGGKIEGTNVAISEGLKICLSCFPQDKQGGINSFLNEMVKIHIGGPQRGVASAYTFEDVQSYRRATDDPLLETFAELTNSRKNRFVTVGRVWQLIEDGLDWAEDMKEHAKNLFLGMATDVWHERGRLEGEDIDYLQKIITTWRRGRIFDFRVNELRGLKSSHVRTTRERYRQEILSQTPQIGGNLEKIMTTTARILL